MQLENSYNAHRPYYKIVPIPFEKVHISDPFWSERQKVNREISIFAQHRHLEEQGHLDNFRITAGQKRGMTKGLFYLDSDLYKWLEGASYILSRNFDKRLHEMVEEMVTLIKQSQTSDGYVNTFFTTKFLEERFTTTYVTHELYCAGHLFQAAIAHYKATGNTTLLKVAERFADLLVHLYLTRHRKGVPGHEEIEMALIDLYRHTGKNKYLKLAKEFLTRRGTIPHFKTYAMNQYLHTSSLLRKAEQLQKEKLKKNTLKGNEAEAKIEEESPEYLTGMTVKDAIVLIRENLNGKVYQLHKPVREIRKPVGHAVRALYLYCGMADLYAETGEEELLKALELIWLKMTKAQMYITGGTGTVKSTEGFGKDFALDPADSYSETCAAIGNLMWNWRMLQITGKTKYAELIERLLYNAVLVGQSIDGLKYTYTNPLKSCGDDTRHEWFICACCPPNIARTISSLGNYIYSKTKNGVYIHQYIGSSVQLTLENTKVRITMESHFPWHGDVQIHIDPSNFGQFSLFLRIPNWAEDTNLAVNGKAVTNTLKKSTYFKIRRIWERGDKIQLRFFMEPKIIKSEPRVKSTCGKVAIRYGPLIYCMEQIDNPTIDIFKGTIAEKPHFQVIYKEKLLGGINIIKGELANNSEFTAIPYYAWGNRGPNKMQVWQPLEKKR
ncbi:MAG: glycoside hydrolase family 127 protein [Promethearchaeia archaeon]